MAGNDSQQELPIEATRTGDFLDGSAMNEILLSNTQKKKASALSFLWLGQIALSKAMAVLLVAAIPTVSTIVIAGGVAWRNRHGGDPNPNKAPVVSRYEQLKKFLPSIQWMNSITR